MRRQQINKKFEASGDDSLQEQRQLFVHLGGGESFMFLVQLGDRYRTKELGQKWWEPLTMALHFILWLFVRAGVFLLPWVSSATS